MKSLFRMFGTRNSRLLKQYQIIVDKINELEPSMLALTDIELRASCATLKHTCTITYNANRATKSESSAQAVLPQAFAICREVSRRVLGLRHFDVQLIGGMVLHDNKIAEMRTGEGKTLAATLACYLNVLIGNKVHVVTVNDYLAQRDANFVRPLFSYLDISVGVNLASMSVTDKQLAYQADIVYGTNNEFCFDYLRDNMVFEATQLVQQGLDFAIVDEVDSILIDEARTPLIISGPAETAEQLYEQLNDVPALLTKQDTEESIGDFWLDEKHHNVILSEDGQIKVENILIEKQLLPDTESLYSTNNINLLHHLLAALKAHYVYFRDKDYVVQNNEIIIVDDFTGRLMPGRRWSDGLHQAVEAKEHVPIQRENQTLASITLQNFFRLYRKLAGMTGTADTEAIEFQQIYRLETVIIGTNHQMIRIDHNDKIYLNTADKFAAVIADVTKIHALRQPILIGTTSVENSELISQMLRSAKLKHSVLNAKQHLSEAEIITQAGVPGSITVATNMAGRGTDIVLGGNPAPEINAIKAQTHLRPIEKEQKIQLIMEKWNKQHNEVVEVGGLYIIGTERHESRRIDNQLRGRAGRQGDPGNSRFYLSLDDSLLRIFGGDTMRILMKKLGMQAGESIENRLLSRSIETAQRKVEAHHFDIRKQLLEYDDVANEQRKIIYTERQAVLMASSLDNMINDMIDFSIVQVIENAHATQLTAAELDAILLQDYQLIVTSGKQTNLEIVHIAQTSYLAKLQAFHTNDIYHTVNSTQFVRNIILEHLDEHWREYLTQLEHLRQGIGLRSYAQKNPKQEYKQESFSLFKRMLDQVKINITKAILTMEFMQETVALEDRSNTLQSRNAICYCGSGNKYKHCHGKLSINS